MRRRELTAQDRQVWASYVQHVAKRAGTATAEPQVQPAPAAPPPSAPPHAPRAASGRHLPPLEVGLQPGGLDRGTWTRFRAGKLATSRTLDLHGRTLSRAHADLHTFLYGAVADGIRCVEVITGRGSGGGGVIRREFSHWLNDPMLRPMVLAASHPHAANPGSVRLLLRRKRLHPEQTPIQVNTRDE